MVAASGMLLYFAIAGSIEENVGQYTYSNYLLITFLGTAAALMRFNAYPASIFIGDTFCYFAGIVLAIASIWGTNSFIQVKYLSFVIGSCFPNCSIFFTRFPSFSAITNVLATGWPPLTFRLANSTPSQLTWTYWICLLEYWALQIKEYYA